MTQNIKNSWQHHWREAANSINWPRKHYGETFVEEVWQKALKYLLTDELAELNNPKDPISGPRVNLPAFAERSLRLAMEHFVCNEHPSETKRWADIAVQLTDAAIAHKAYWTALNPYANKSNVFVMAAGEAKALKYNAMGRWLRDQTLPTPEIFYKVALAFELAADNGAAQHDTLLSRVYVNDAIRAAVLAGEPVLALVSVNKARPMDGFERMFAGHAQLAKAIHAAKGGVVSNAADIAAFDIFFDAVRFPHFALDHKRSELEKTFLKATLNDEPFFMPQHIVALELALIKDRYFHGHAVPDAARIIQYISE